MTNLGSGELLLVLFIALIVLGPERLPEAARKIGGFVRQIRTMSNGFQEEIKKAIDIDAITKPTDKGDVPFHPEEAHIRPTPAIEAHAEPDLESDIRAANTEPEAPVSEVEALPTAPPVGAHVVEDDPRDTREQATG